MQDQEYSDKKVQEGGNGMSLNNDSILCIVQELYPFNGDPDEDARIESLRDAFIRGANIDNSIMSNAIDILSNAFESIIKEQRGLLSFSFLEILESELEALPECDKELLVENIKNRFLDNGQH